MIFLGINHQQLTESVNAGAAMDKFIADRNANSVQHQHGNATNAFFKPNPPSPPLTSKGIDAISCIFPDPVTNKNGRLHKSLARILFEKSLVLGWTAQVVKSQVDDRKELSLGIVGIVNHIHMLKWYKSIE